MLLCPVSKQCHGASVYYTACCCLFAVMTCSQRSSIVRVKRGGRVGVDAVVQVKPTSKCSVDSVVAPCWSSRQHAVSCKLELVTEPWSGCCACACCVYTRNRCTVCSKDTLIVFIDISAPRYLSPAACSFYTFICRLEES